ncbi:Glycosyl transferases group 1 OS=Streptomyces microflavus OX=1919 GN=Smic_23940 PE=4 SV=1 [Streptomyces microflavus]
MLPLLEDLDRRKVIELKLAEKVSWSRIRAMVQEADLVIDQFAVGMYGTFACESMAAGKPVIAYLDDESVALSGVTPPIVNASPDSLGQVLEQLLDDRHAAARIGIDSVKYVRAHHDGTATAAALASFLTV